jgi:class 3 adenylate cyclase
MAEPLDPVARLRHDLRTPLNHVIGYSEMLLESIDSFPTLENDLRRIHRQGYRLLTLVNEVLAGTAAGAGALPPLSLELGTALGELHAAVDGLRERAASVGTERLSSDVERIASAARELSTLFVPSADAPGGAAGDEAPAAGSRGTILVVDDNTDNREILARRLAREGYRIHAAAGGLEALQILRRETIELVLLDVMMPQIDGYEVLRRLKADEALRDIPVLMISALDEIESVVRCIELGADDYLTKPFNAVLLRARIGACLERRRLHEKERVHLLELAEWNRQLEERVQEQVLQVERLGRLKRFFSPQLADLIVAGGTDDPLQTHRREITVVFLDLRGFTAFAETSEPEEVMSVLRAYHAAMGRLILEHEGTLERFTGDGMMVFFNDPVPVTNPAERALRMALAMRDRVAELSGRWRRQDWDLALGVGIAQGYATIGAIGFEGRWDYGAIGTVTNTAARLCSEAKGGQILVSSRVAAAVEHLVEVEEVGSLALKGLRKPAPTFNVRALRSGA